MHSPHSWFFFELMAKQNLTPRAEPAASPLASAAEVVDFWRTAGPPRWFAKDAEFDRGFRELFAATHEAARHGQLQPWQDTAEGALALLLLLDQYPRNAFRGTSRMYDTDARARRVAAAAIAAGHDLALEVPLRVFVYLPFGHSESLADQERAVALVRERCPSQLAHAERHCAIIRRFGRFPHRNALLSRPPRAEEERYLAEGGYAG